MLYEESFDTHHLYFRFDFLYRYDDVDIIKRVQRFHCSSVP